MIYFISLLFGLALGSFSNVCILRLPHDESLLFPRSRCPRCHHALKNIHNIPVVSFLVLKGRCAFCHIRISAQYPLIEALMGLFFIANALRFPSSAPHLILADLLTFYLITISIIDFKHKIIPDELSLTLLVIGLLGSFINPLFEGSLWIKGAQSLCWALGGGLLMLLMAWAGEKTFKKEALGGGDIKLIAATASVLGWPGILGPLMIGSFSGGFVALVLLVLKKKNWGETLPFGPFLSIGAYLTCLFPGWWTYLFGQK